MYHYDMLVHAASFVMCVEEIYIHIYIYILYIFPKNEFVCIVMAVEVSP